MKLTLKVRLFSLEGGGRCEAIPPGSFKCFLSLNGTYSKCTMFPEETLSPREDKEVSAQLEDWTLSKFIQPGLNLGIYWDCKRIGSCLVLKAS